MSAYCTVLTYNMSTPLVHILSAYLLWTLRPFILTHTIEFDCSIERVQTLLCECKPGGLTLF